MHDVFATIAISGAAAADGCLPMAYDELKSAYDRRLDELKIERERRPDIVMIAVPQGRGYQVSQNLAAGGFAHGDVVVRDG
jgi:hypothetical protein